MLSQKSYIDNLRPFALSVSRRLHKSEHLKQSEIREYRKIVGQLNWASRQTRPDLVFDVLELSMKFNHPCVHDLIRANKSLKKLQSVESALVFPGLGNPEDWYIFVMSDAAFANLVDNVSSAGGYIILLVGEGNKCAALSWRANKIKRVVKSTLAAETLELDESLNHAIYIKELIKQMIGTVVDMPIEVWTDSKNSYKGINSTTQVEDRRLRIDIAAIKEKVKKELVTVKWCPGSEMLANCLTKCGASSDGLLNVISMVIG